MEGFLLLQFVCICSPALLALLIWGAIAVVSPHQSRFAIRFDLTTLLMFMTAIGIVLMFSKAASHHLAHDFERIMVCFISFFTLPAIWLIQITIDEFRDQRRQREARKQQTLQNAEQLGQKDQPGEGDVRQ